MSASLHFLHQVNYEYVRHAHFLVILKIHKVSVSYYMFNVNKLFQALVYKPSSQKENIGCLLST